jgi:hypothetical protein
MEVKKAYKLEVDEELRVEVDCPKNEKVWNVYKNGGGIKKKQPKKARHFSQCWGSGMFIPDPKTTKEKGGKKFVVLPFFGATSITEQKISLLLNRRRKKFGPIYKEF